MKKRSGSRRSLALVLCLVGMVVLGLSGWQIYATLQSKRASNADDTKSSSTIPASVQVDETVDTTKPTPDVLANYHTAADVPRALYVDALGLRARIVGVGLGADSSMQTPKNIYDSGWYTASARPGTIGAVVIDGHASGATRMGLFAYIDTLKNGDDITVETGDGSIYHYRVVHNETRPMADVDMTQVLQPYGGMAEGLNLITCTGKWLPAQRTYDHRVVVYAERVK